jgi:surface antigen
MRVIPALVIIVGLCAPLLAQPQPIAGMIAKRETDLLSYEDRLAAYDAEQAVLANEWGTQGYNWKGPNGAYGTIISSGAVPQPNSNVFCRRFIHIVHHNNDGGANPTFHGRACRPTPDAPWEAK